MFASLGSILKLIGNGTQVTRAYFHGNFLLPLVSFSWNYKISPKEALYKLKAKIIK